MLRLNKKGFLLLDSLICVCITSLVCVLCFSIYEAIINYDDGFNRYQILLNEELENIYNTLPDCEVCIIDESD